HHEHDQHDDHRDTCGWVEFFIILYHHDGQRHPGRQLESASVAQKSSGCLGSGKTFAVQTLELGFGAFLHGTCGKKGQ
ncbi:MAG: hypothetical protein M3Q89_07270, partial [Verrucomicrobiota bacterium]|nr:hypothetical protein [Verrucomicrobiota bacterium]